MSHKVVFVEISQVESAFPLASAYLHNHARKHALSAREYSFVIRPFHAGASVEQVVDAVSGDDGDIFAFSCYAWNMKRIRGVVAALQERNPRATFLLGGPQVLTCAERYVAPHQTNVFVCNGEGENTMCAFLDAHAAEKPDYATVPGLSFFRDGELQTTAPAPQVELDSIPSPFLHSPFDASTYFVHYLWETNRGCPFHCTFCLWGQLQDSISKFDIERLKEEITWLARRQYMSLHICDANWGMLPRDLELVEHIARCKRDFGVPFIIGAAHVKNQPDRLLRMTEVFDSVGIRANTANALQSVNEATLVTIKRRNTPAKKLATFQSTLAERGFGSIVEIIWPLPEETLETLTGGFESLAQMRIGSVLCYPLMLLNNTEMSARRSEHGFATIWDPSDVKEIEWVVSTKDVSRAECEDGFWFYLAFMLLYNARTLYYTLHYLNEEHGISYQSVLWQFARALSQGHSPLSELCRRIVVDRDPSLDGATFGTVFGWGLHAHRAEFDVFLTEFCARQAWWELPNARAVVELDLLARPFLFANPNLFAAPSVALTELSVEVGERRLVVSLPRSVYDWLRRNAEVGRLDEDYTGFVLLDHARDQLPYVPRKTDEDAGYLLTSLLTNVRSICPRLSACDAAGATESVDHPARAHKASCPTPNVPA